MAPREASMSDVTFEPLPCRHLPVTPRIFIRQGDGWLDNIDSFHWPLLAWRLTADRQ